MKDASTDEEFDNFLQQVTEIEKIINKLTSQDINDQKQGQVLADAVLKNQQIPQDPELKTTSSRTIINKSPEDDLKKDAQQMSKEVFMQTVEKDAKERAHNFQIRKERAKTFQIIGNTAFKEGALDKATTFFTKAIEVRRDSPLLWNNRALCYIKLGIYEKALSDCQQALKIDESNLKALLNSAKCYKFLNNQVKQEEFLNLARERNSRFVDFIQEFEAKLNTEQEDSISLGD